MFTKIFYHPVHMTKEMVRQRLLGKHMNIHDLDFEVMESERALRVVPHAEQIDSIMTLPVTRIDVVEKDGATQLKMVSHIRKMDAGGPILLMILMLLLASASAVLWMAREHFFSMIMGSIFLAILLGFLYKLQVGYYDYVRKTQLNILKACGLEDLDL